MLASVLLVLAPAAPQVPSLQHPQTTFPAPTGSEALTMGRAVAIDGDRALVALGLPSSLLAPEVWIYERDGLAWTPTTPFPISAPIEAPLLDLAGDRAFIGSSTGTFDEYELQNGAWTLTDSLAGFQPLAIDVEAGTAIGKTYPAFPRYHAIAERGDSGWAIVWTDTAATTISFGASDYAIEGDVAAIGGGPWFACSHFAWDGIVNVIERAEPLGSQAPATWTHSFDAREPSCTVESRLGEWVAVHDGRVFATYDHWWGNFNAGIRVFDRSSAGTWSMVQELNSDQMWPNVGNGLTVENGLLVTGSTDHASVRNAVHVFESNEFGHWYHTRRFDVDDLPIASSGPSFSHRIDFHVYDVAAPAATGIGNRQGVVYVNSAAGPDWEANVVAAFDPAVSATVCPGVFHSSGPGAKLSIAGSDVLGDRRMQFHVAGLPANTLALPLVSMEFGFIANPGGSDGNLCIGASATRLVPLAGQASDVGTFQVDLDLDALPQSPLQSGDRLFFQTWYRDVPTTNFSSAVAVQVI